MSPDSYSSHEGVTLRAALFSKGSFTAVVTHIDGELST
jgi:hypothetical protein